MEAKTRRGVPRTALAVGLALLLTSALTSCAAVFRGTTQTVPIESRPAGAEVFVDGERVGVTPVRVPLWRGKSHDVVVRLGGRERRVRVSSTLDGAGGVWLLADIAPGGVIVGTALVGMQGDTVADLGLALIAVGGLGLAVVPTTIDLATGAVARLDPTRVFIDFSVDAP